MDPTNARLVLQDPQVSVFAFQGTDNSLFRHLLTVRSHDPHGRCHFPFDDYSTHYCMFVESRPVGAITATRLVEGAVDCSQFYPQCLLDHFRDTVFSSCKLRILRSARLGFHGLRTLVRGVWQDQLSRGARLDIMNADRQMQAFYERVGYVAVRGSEFVHPLLGTESIAMLMMADPARRSFCQEEFQGISQPLSLESVRAVVELCQ